MAQIYIKDFVGIYHRDGDSPNHFTSSHTGIELILKTRPSTTNGMPPNYLLFKGKDSDKFHFFTSLWSVKNAHGTYRISDTQKVYGVCKLDLFTIEIQAK
jgi:hypothetical protein